MTDHQEQQVCQANTDKSWTIPPGSFGQTHSKRPIRRYSKTIGKPNTYKPHIHPEQTNKNTQNGTHTSNTLHKSMTTNNEDNISQTNREVNNGQKVSVNSMPFNRNAEENTEGSDAHIRTRYGRIVWKWDRLTYLTFYFCFVRRRRTLWAYL